LEQKVDQDEVTFDDEKNEEFSEVCLISEIRDEVCDSACD